MDIKGDSVRLINVLNKLALTLITTIIILNIQYSKVSAKVNSNLNVDINNKVYSVSNLKSDNMLDNLIVALTGKVNGYEVVLDDTVIGYTFIENSLDNIKEIVLQEYITENNIKEDMVKSFDIKGDIELIEDRFDVELLQTNEDLANSIYNLAEKYPDKVKINITYLKEEINSIEPSTLIIPTEDLYLGQSKVEEGSYGVKKDTKEITSESGEIIYTKIVEEEIIKDQISKKIYRGTKNPYDYGVAFLSHPTRGGFMTSGYGERWNSFHKGIDIAGNMGDDVFASMDGKVIYAQYNDGGYGNLIIIEHEDDMNTYYGHLSDFYVKVGDKVKKGDVIGAVGSTGFSTGPHLHFELRVDNEPVDPTDYIVQ